MGLKLIHISKRANWWSNPLDITLVVLTINCPSKTFPDFAIKVLCFLTTVNLTFKFQLLVHEKLSWRNCKCPVDLWQPGQIVLKKYHPSKIPNIYRIVGVCWYSIGWLFNSWYFVYIHVSITYTKHVVVALLVYNHLLSPDWHVDNFLVLSSLINIMDQITNLSWRPC